MSRKYFDQFPTINYNGYNVKNITASAKLVNRYLNIPYVYDTFSLDKNQRADQVSYQLYDDPYMSWLIYYSNKIIDPYYGWILNQNNFDNMIKEKYGSIQIANRKIISYRSNWDSDNRELDTNQFNHLFGNFKSPHTSYWAVKYASNGKDIISYVRNDKENFIDTNKIAKIKTSNNNFEVGKLIDIKRSGALIGTAEVISANTNYVFIKNIMGDVQTGDQLKVYLESSNCTITEYSNTYNPSSNTWTLTNISNEEYIYWEPYTALQKEIDENSSKYELKVMDARAAIKISDKLEEELNS